LLSSLGGQSARRLILDIFLTIRRIHSRIVQQHESVNVASAFKTDKNIFGFVRSDPLLNTRFRPLAQSRRLSRTNRRISVYRRPVIRFRASRIDRCRSIKRSGLLRPAAFDTLRNSTQRRQSLQSAEPDYRRLATASTVPSAQDSNASSEENCHVIPNLNQFYGHLRV
jgi:hypothetical protein